jgi:SAM-dependent methyltransferase
LQAVHRYFPEIAAGGFTRVDGTIEFYSRVNSLLKDDMTVVDYGAGRGAGPLEDPVPYRRNLLTLQGKCERLIGIDVAEAVLSNTAVDEAHKIDPGDALPLPDASVDMMVSDWVLEHISEPEALAGEIARVLKPGGWFCARTPNRWGYIGIGANLVPNQWHQRFLKHLQPQKKDVDTFPTTYRMNTEAKLKSYFPEASFERIIYGHFGEPAYFGQSLFAWSMVLTSFRLTPERFAPVLMAFFRRR